jgi:predicted nucleic acid-binding protein
MNNEQEWDYQQSVFLDQTALTAYMNPDDPYYAKARSFFLDLDDLDRNFVTTSYIVFETHQWLRDNYGYSHAEFFLNTMDKAAGKGRLAIVGGNGKLEQEAKNLLLQVPECKFTLNESVTAVVMLTYRIKRIFTFNRSFLSLPSLHEDIRVIPSSV